MKIGVSALPPLPKDATDRNRTSPFAFTGNKFEFRAPGSSVSCALPNTVLNTVVAESMDRIAEELEKSGVVGKAEPGKHTAAFHDKLQRILQNIIKTHKRILFNGDGYTAGWLEEAAKRGLPNAATTPEALKAFEKAENIALFEKAGVFSAREMASRLDIAMEDYATKVAIEGNTALEIARTMILPAVRAEYVEALKAYNETDASNVKDAIDVLRAETAKLGKGLVMLQKDIDELEQAIAAGKPETVLATMSTLRAVSDSLEKVVSDDRWPLPKYREMLFLY